MTNDESETQALAIHLLGLFPPAIRDAVLEDRAFRDRFGLIVDMTIRLDEVGIAFGRSGLFRAIRSLFKGEIVAGDLVDTEGRQWTIEFTDEKKRFQIRQGDRLIVIPDFSCLSDNREQRLGWFDRETARFRVSDNRIDQWRAILQEREIEDEEVDPLFSEFRHTHSFFGAAVAYRLKRQEISVKSLVPSDLPYYDRLVGDPGTRTRVKDYFESVAPPLIQRLIQQDPLEGLKDAFLLSAHSFGPQAIPLSDFRRETVLNAYDWLEASGDRFSQIGAIECGLAHLDTFPELEPCLARLVRLVLEDTPDDKDGRLSLVCGLIVLVEGELARIGICRNRSPHWRRLASIAHASVLERVIVGTNMVRSDVFAWAMESRWRLYDLQTFVDMRLEPRWHPDFLSPDQLQAEFIGRISGIAHSNLAKVKSGELRGLLDGDENSARSRLSPFSILPGPLEGGIESTNDMPSEIEESLRASLGEGDLTPNSFARLANSALIYRVGAPLAQLAADALRRVKYQLRQIKSQDEAFSLLSGLARVASVTRSADLADEVRILMRVVRRRAGIDISQANAIRIALVAAAAHANIAEWCKFVGDCVTEFAFEEIGLDEARELQHIIRVLRDLEPRLSGTVARAEAAMSALVASSAA